MFNPQKKFELVIQQQKEHFTKIWVYKENKKSIDFEIPVSDFFLIDFLLQLQILVSTNKKMLRVFNDTINKQIQLLSIKCNTKERTITVFFKNLMDQKKYKIAFIMGVKHGIQ